MVDLRKTREFVMQEKLMSFRDKVWIMNTKGDKLGYFEGKLISIGNTYRLRTMDDKAILTAHEKAISLKNEYQFYWGEERDDKKLIGKLKKKVISIKPKFWFEGPDEKELFTMKGNIFKLKYEINKNGKQIAEISKKLFKIRDTYGVRISNEASDDDTMLILGIVISLHHEMEEAKNR